MKLKCKINGIEYALVEGVTFSDEYNETLDSGSIIISDITQIQDLAPYDRVYIWDTTSAFKKYMLVDSYTEEMLNLEVGGLYKYKINLFSETKALEKVQCPNISITQPLKSELKRSVWFYLQQFVGLYSPKVKKVLSYSVKTWQYSPKYTLDPNLEDIYDGVFCPEISMTAPSLRDVLSQIMIVKDCIPYVENNVIKALDISKRNGAFLTPPSKTSFVFGSMSSESYTTGLRREYSGAISQENTAQMVEYLGFRNSGSALLTFDNLQLETRFPIYKINKINMCYYKRIKVQGGNDKMFLCKQDITPLILQNSVRNTLPKDWVEMESVVEVDAPTTVEALAEFKLATLGYDIGSNIIKGFGEKYKYPTILWFSNTRTIIENIVAFMDKNYKYGTKYKNNFGMVLDSDELPVGIDDGWLENSLMPFTNQANKFKGLFFEVDYNAMYHGAVLHSKDNVERDDVITNDNSSAGLSILETDGLFQKEKANRLGNKIFTFTARYKDYNEMHNTYNNRLGAVYGDDVVIYHRDYSIYENGVDATFIGSYDYVMKNYFTSVWAKLRTYNLMPYSESVKRAENIKYDILLSNEKAYFENTPILAGLDNKKLLSAFKPTPTPENIDKFVFPDKINAGYFTFEGNDTHWYMSDVNAFVAGYALCFNVRMYDNVSSGVYLDKNYLQKGWTEGGEDYTGTVQRWHLHATNPDDAFLQNVGCFLCHIDNDEYFGDKVQPFDATEANNLYYYRLLELPRLPIPPSDKRSNTIGKVFNFCKDNKEVLDITFQFEPIAYENDDIMFSQWLMKLNDLSTTYKKWEIDTEINDTYGATTEIDVMWYVHRTPGFAFRDFYASLVLKVPNGLFENFMTDEMLEIYPRSFNYYQASIGYTQSYKIDLKEITSRTENSITVKAFVVYSDFYSGAPGVTISRNQNLVFELYETDDTNFTYLRCYINEAFDIGVPKEPDNIKLSGSKSESFVAETNPYVINTSNAYVDKGTVIVNGVRNTKTYAKNMFILYSANELKKTLVYDELEGESFVLEGYYKTNIRVQSVFNATNDDKGLPVIEVNQGIEKGYVEYNFGEIKSIQYWYRGDDNILRFVFGVNLQNEKTYNIYLSLLSKKDKRVFDSNGNVVGMITNHAQSDKNYGSTQYFDVV